MLQGPDLQEEIIFSQQDRPFGINLREWTVRWWKWVLSIPEDINPGMDTTGENLILNQPYSEVIFMVGTFEGHAERNYTLPAEKAILFPVINFITSFIEEPRLKTEEDLVRSAEQDIKSLTNVVAKINGKALKNIHRFRIQSKPFELTYPERNVFGLPTGTTKAISDGYWIFLKKLERGWYDIEVDGSCYSGTTQESTSWHLNVI